MIVNSHAQYQEVILNTTSFIVYTNPIQSEQSIVLDFPGRHVILLDDLLTAEDLTIEAVNVVALGTIRTQRNLTIKTSSHTFFMNHVSVSGNARLTSKKMYEIGNVHKHGNPIGRREKICNRFLSAIRDEDVLLFVKAVTKIHPDAPMSMLPAIQIQIMT